MTAFDELHLELGWPAALELHGERVRYKPDAGARREFDAIVTVGSLPGSEADQEHKVETAIVECEHSATEGIDQPKKGALLYRIEEEGDDAQPFVFTGEVLVSTTVLLHLKFTRDKLTRLGHR